MIIKDGKNVVLSASANNVIIAELANNAACKNYKNCISGTFQYQNKANGIIVANGRIIGANSAHGWLGYPDSVILCSNDGKLSIERLVSFPAERLSEVKWAISGMGLLDNYNPAAEGYAKFKKNGKSNDYSDVLRKTHHTALGVKDGEVYGFYLANMTGKEVNAYVKEFGCDMAIMLDGGHVASVNCDIYSANASQKQHNIIQFVQTEEKETAKDDYDMDMVRVYSARSEGNKKVSTNFHVREYACKDGAELVLIHPKLAEILQKIRTHFGRPVTITSAFRTEAHNKKVGGEANSQHLYGRAADIKVTGVTPKKVAEYAETLLPNTGGIGIYSNFTHIDCRQKKARW
jgi:uncharacterized protein YcbK (DUF882 family)